jgi:GNAT superfamily N-acetyltransferase
MQKKPGKFPQKITSEKPKIYKQDGFNVTEIYKWTPDFISDFSPDIYQTMCRDKNAIVLCLSDTRRNNIPIGFIYGQKQVVYNRKLKKNTEIVYVGGLYLLPEYRGKGLAAVLISNLVGKWWDKCNQFIFLHDKKILDNTIKPIQEKEIYIYCPWIFLTYTQQPHNTKSQRTKTLGGTSETRARRRRYISFSSPKNNSFLEKNFGITYHIHGYSAYIHEIEDNQFNLETMMKISTKHPWLIWIYVPAEYCSFRGSGSYKRYIYGYNLKGGGEKKKYHYGVYDI